jgi:hypothetical protein
LLPEKTIQSTTFKLGAKNLRVATLILILSVLKPLGSSISRVNSILPSVVLKSLFISIKKVWLPPNLSTLDKVILKSQIAISSGGSVLWHFISMRLPSIVINQADNQIQNSKYLNKLGLIKLFNAHFNNNSLEKFLIKNIFENKKKFNISNKFSNLFDNKGLKRIANVILS